MTPTTTSSNGNNVKVADEPEPSPVSSPECHLAAVQYDARTYPNAAAMAQASGHSTTDTGNYGNCWVIPAAHFCKFIDTFTQHDVFAHTHTQVSDKLLH
jgi:hypothetical protein